MPRPTYYRLFDSIVHCHPSTVASTNRGCDIGDTAAVTEARDGTMFRGTTQSEEDTFEKDREQTTATTPNRLDARSYCTYRDPSGIAYTMTGMCDESSERVRLTIHACSVVSSPSEPVCYEGIRAVCAR